MTNVTTLPKTLIQQVREEAEAQLKKELTDKAKTALIKKLRDWDTAKKIVANIEREIADLEKSIEDGSFSG